MLTAMRFFFCAALLALSSPLWAQGQQTLSGQTQDARSGSSLPFVHIRCDQCPQGGTVSDVDGYFRLPVAAQTDTLFFSYVGYQKRLLLLDTLGGPFQGLAIGLRPQVDSVQEVTIRAGANPAHRIIRKAIAQRKANNPLNYESFQFRNYSRYQATLTKKEDSSQVSPKTEKLIDSLNRQQYLFLSETLTETRYEKQGKWQKKVLSNQSSGVKPGLVTTASTIFQNFGFYEDQVEILGQSYTNPLTPGTFRRYRFFLEEKRPMGLGDTLFVISYLPEKNPRFEALKGALYIHSQGWALKSVTARPFREPKVADFRIRQDYQRYDSGASQSPLWFPQQTLTEVRYKKLDMEGADLALREKSWTTNNPFAPNKPEAKLSQTGGKLVDADTLKRYRQLLESHRPKPLNARDSTTYRRMEEMMDSTGLRPILNNSESLMLGRIPIAQHYYLLMSSLVGYNRYEGFQLGFGGGTLPSLSKVFQLEAAARYGFLDDAWKQRVRLLVRPFPQRSLELKAFYRQELAEPGLLTGTKPQGLLDNSTYRRFIARWMDHYEAAGASVAFRPLHYARLAGSYRYYEREDGFRHDYFFRQGEDTLRRFRYHELRGELRLAKGERFLNLLGNRLKTGEEYPVFRLRYAAGLARQGPGNYHRLEAELTHLHQWRGPFETRFHLRAGNVWGDAPLYAQLRPKDAYQGFSGLHLSEHFATMRLYEFRGKTLVSSYLKHRFGPLFVSEKSAPEPVVQYGATYTPPSTDPEQFGAEAKAADPVFHEVAAGFEHLYSVVYADLAVLEMGLMGHYRIGGHHIRAEHENWALTFVTGFSF